MRRRLLAAVGAWAVCAWALAADGPAPARTPTPEHLVAQLGSERYADREAAAKALAEAGPAAIPLLKAAAGGPNPEVARRAGDILAQLQRIDDSARRLVAKTVRLAYKDVPLGTAVNDLKTQTGLNVVLDPAKVADPLRKITCQTGDLPAWEAVEAFCKAAGVKELHLAELEVPKTDRPNQPAGRRVYYTPPPPPPAPDAVPITLADGMYEPLPGSRSTAVRIVALPGSFPGNRVNLGTGDVTLNFDIAPAPGLNWQDVTGIRITKVIDDAGRFGGAGAPPDTGYSPSPYDNIIWAGPGRVVMRWDFDSNPTLSSYPNPRIVPVSVKVATPSARSLKLLEGVIVCELVNANQPLATIDDPVNNAGTTVKGPNGTRMSVQDVKDGGKDGKTVVRVQLEAPSLWAAQRRRNPWWPMWPEPARPMGAGNQVQAFDTAGKLIPLVSTSFTQASDDGTTSSTVMQFTYREGSGVPAKLVLVGPRPVTVEIPFKMENVKLP